MPIGLAPMMSVLSPAAVMVSGYGGQYVPVWVLALFSIKRLIKEAIETPSSPIAAVQETGQLLSIYCPTRPFKIQFQGNLETPPGLIMCSLAAGKLLSGFASGTITGRTFCGSHKIPTPFLDSKAFVRPSGRREKPL